MLEGMKVLGALEGLWVDVPLVGDAERFPLRISRLEAEIAVMG